jgi:hypothetical protein
LIFFSAGEAGVRRTYIIKTIKTKEKSDEKETIQ